MAAFNPQVPATQDPNYFRYSEPIKTPEANKSTGIALATLGEGIDSTAKLADQTIKKSLDTQVDAFADKQRDDFTSALVGIRNSNVLPQPANTALSFEDSNASMDVPDGVKNGTDKIDSIQTAYSQGKINDTFYHMRLAQATKDLRAQYPGYRDYIDQRVSQATGVNPANAYVMDLMQDINRAQTNKKTEADKLVDLARGAMSTGIPGSQEQYTRLTSDPGYAPKFLEWYTQANENKYKIEADNAVRANRKGTREEAAQDDKEKFTNLVGRTLDTNFHSMVTIPGVDTPQGILEFSKLVAAHPEQYSGAVLETLASQILAQKAVLKTQLIAESNKDRPGGSYTSTIGPSGRDEVINSQLASYDAIYDAFKNKDAGLAYWHMNQARARLDDTKDNLLSGPAGKDLATFKVLQDTAGPAWTGLVVNEALRKDIEVKMRPLFNQSSIEARAQPDFAATGRPTTFKEHSDKALELEKAGKITSSMRSRYTGNLVNIVDDLKNPNAPDSAKINVVRYLFSPEGQGVLANIKTDYTDPNTGKVVPGKYSVFNRFTSDDIVQSVAKLAKSDPQIGTMYKNYLENEAGSQLFYKELQNLNHFTGHDDLHFSYDSDSHKINLIDKAGKPAIPAATIGGSSLGTPTANPIYPNNPSAGYLSQVQKIVNRVNDGLAGLGRVEQGMGGDVNTYLLNFLQHAQVNMGQNWTGLPQRLMDAIAASRAPARKIEDTFKDMNK